MNNLCSCKRCFDPTTQLPRSFDVAKVDLRKTVNLAKKLEEAEQATKIATERYSKAETQLDRIRSQHNDEISELDARHQSSRRALLEELDPSQLNSRRSPTLNRHGIENIKPFNAYSTPPNMHRQLTTSTNNSTRSDRTVDSMQYNKRMDFAAEIEQLQNQLQMSEMRNRHLQTQLEHSPSKSWQDDSPSTRRVQRLERENTRLHGMLDDSAKKVSALENSIRSGHLTLKEVQTKSHEELFDLINSQEQSRRSLLSVHNAAVAELADAKVSFDDVKQAKANLEVEARDAKSELDDLKYEREQDDSSRAQLLQEFAELQMKLDTETSNLLEAQSNVALYKARADEYYNKLEQAEIAVVRASRAEQFAKSQGREAEDTCSTIISERKQMDAMVEDLQRKLQSHDERIEDLSADLDGAMQAKKRLQNELEDYRGQRAMDIEDKETSIEQTRKKYQSELSTLHAELEMDRQSAINIRGENSRLRDELEDLRAKWDEEVLNSSTWAKEKSRLDMQLESLTNARDEAANAHNEAQSKVVSLLSQVRTLRTSFEDATAGRDAALKEKKSIEARLGEMSERLDELGRSHSPSMQRAASSDKELLQVKADLAQKEDVAVAAVDKMRRSEALVQEVQKDLTSERDTNVRLHKEKATLDKTVKELQLRLVDLETKGYSSASQDVRFLHGRIQELEKQLDTLEDSRTKEVRSVRNVDRTVKDLQLQIERREKANSALNDDLAKSRDKVERLLANIDELQNSDSTNQLAAKRAERELREEREKALRLERELEGWKALRMDRGEMRRSGTFRAMSEIGSDIGRRRREGSAAPSEGLQRNESLTKNFL